MPVATRRELLEAGVHFGHQTRRWNPKMHRYLYGERSGIYIIDLEQTLGGLKEAYDFVIDLGRRGGTVLFVGTKKQAQDIVEEQAGRVRMPFVNTRWLGGMLTNFQTVHARVAKLRELQRIIDTGEVDQMIKKEGLKVRRELAKLERNLGGIRTLERSPDAVFVIDTKKEHIAVTEARKLGLPVIAIVDTNCDPDEVDYIIPGNDDAIRAVSLVTRVIADALEEGQTEGWREFAERTAEPEIEPEAASIPASQVFEPHEPARPAPVGSQVFEPDAPPASQVFEPDEPARPNVATPEPDEIAPETSSEAS